ncbi:MAG: FMN-binding protein [Lachnospiraceae bacterium]|nr:FMN-binding protein [Lachnospiraceae bacterium]
MKKNLPNVYVLTGICLITALLLALVNNFTLPVIKAAEEKATQEALLEVLPGGGTFEKKDVSAIDTSFCATKVEEIYKASNGGYVVKLTSSGYSTGLLIMVGVNADGTVSGSKCLASAETLGYEKTYGSALLGADKDNISGIATVSGATKTTTGYKNAVADALKIAAALSGN